MVMPGAKMFKCVENKVLFIVTILTRRRVYSAAQ